MSNEKVSRARSGWGMLTAVLVLIPVLLAMFVASGKAFDTYPPTYRVVGAIGLFLSLIGVVSVVLIFIGFFALQPNTAAVLILFGEYRGTVRESGFYWANPFLKKHRLSLRVRNFNSDKLKVNDLRGSPIEIGAVVVWRVVDTFRAAFEVDDYNSFVHIQSESALRHLASTYAYDPDKDHEKSLRGSMDEVSKSLQMELQARLDKAGIVVDEARLSHLAYAPEIAGAMLRRQQAEAVVAARAKIVEGAVGMVEAALDHMARSKTITLDDERKAAMVSNLMVVLCGDHSAQPVVNTGSLYS
ncbi:MAG: SPFH domain-containing protein [Phycisphaerae bacterium]|nr:SPFH domain-containing protein [Phycisphaerae bacterium]